MKTLIENIKTLVAEQKDLKNPRKTVNLQGARIIDPQSAATKHFYNRIKLREMYAALGLIKGKTLEEIEPNAKTSVSMKNVNKLIEIHGTEIISAS